MLETNPEIQSIIESATLKAAEKNHEYVTLEHLVLAMLTHAPFNSIVTKFGCDTDKLISEVEGYLDQQTYLVSKGYDIVPKKTCLLYTSPSPRDRQKSRMPSSA